MAARESVCDILSDAGYECLTATDGSDAIAKLAQAGERPCVILESVERYCGAA